jgi:hypothetical protein
MIYMGLYYAIFEDLAVVTISITVHPVVCTNVSEVSTITSSVYMETRNRPGVVQRVPGGLGSKIS